MGIKYLNKYLQTNCSNSIKQVSLNDLRDKKIVIDTSIYLYRFLGENTLLENFYLMISIFREYNIIPLFVSADQQKIDRVKSQWKELDFKEKLLILRPVYNSLIMPIVQVLHKNDLRDPEKGCSVVVIPEVVNTKWWHLFLHNQNSKMLKLAIATMDKKDDKTALRVIISVPYKSE